jgi:hypothetical protein
MGMSRYGFSKTVKGTVGPSRASYVIYKAVKAEIVQVTYQVSEAGQRLDQVAGKMYGDASLWWIIAAASGIGWGMQVPPGVVLKIPTSPEDVITLLL